MDEGKASSSSSWSETNREGKVDDSWEEEAEGKVASNNLGELAENALSGRDLQVLRSSTSETLADMDDAMSRLDAWQAERARARKQLLADLHAADAASAAASASSSAPTTFGLPPATTDADAEDIVSAHNEKRLQEELASLEAVRRGLERGRAKDVPEGKSADGDSGAVAGGNNNNDSVGGDAGSGSGAAFAAYIAAKRARDLSEAELAKLRAEAERSAADIAGGDPHERKGDTRSAELRALQAGVRRLEVTQLEKSIMAAVEEEQRTKTPEGHDFGGRCGGNEGPEAKESGAAAGLGSDGDTFCELDMQCQNFNRDLDRILRRMDEVS